VLLVLAVVVVGAAEWPRALRGTSEVRRGREREKRKAKLRVITGDPESDDFVESVRRDLDSLPTIDEPRTRRGK
jgi:hypothetical protein